MWLSGIAAYLLVGFLSLAASVALRRGSARRISRSRSRPPPRIAMVHAVINLFPVLPLDMAHAALAWGNPDVRRIIQQIAGFGVLGFMVFFFILSFLGVISGLVRLFLQVFLNIIAALSQAY